MVHAWTELQIFTRQKQMQSGDAPNLVSLRIFGIQRSVAYVQKIGWERLSKPKNSTRSLLVPGNTGVFKNEQADPLIRKGKLSLVMVPVLFCWVKDHINREVLKK